MILNANSKELLAALNVVSKLTKKNSPQPIESCIVIERDNNGTITLRATTSESGMKMASPLQTNGDFTPVCVNPAQLIQLLSAFPDTAIELRFDTEKWLCEVSCANGSYSFPIDPAENFPPVPERKTAKVEFTMPANIFCQAAKTGYPCSFMSNNLRPTMASLAIDVKEDGVVLVASNGQLLYKREYRPGVPFISGYDPILLKMPRDFSKTASAILSGETDMKVAFDGTCIFIETSDYKMFVREIEGKYPNYSAVIPSDNPYKATFATKELAAALRRVMMMTSEASRLVVLTYKNGKITLSGEDVDFSRASEESVETSECSLPDGFAIGLQADYALDTLGGIVGDDVTITFSSPSRAMTVVDGDATQCSMFLLMPMLLQDATTDI